MEIGNGITLSGSVSGAIMSKITGLQTGPHTRNMIRSSHMGTTGAHTFEAAALVDYGYWTIEGFLDPDASIPIGAAAETWTITWPDGTTWAATGQLDEDSANAPFEDSITQTIKIKIQSAPVVT